MSGNQISEERDLPGSHTERPSFPFPSLITVHGQHSKPSSNPSYASKSSFPTVFPDTLLHTPEPHSVQASSVYSQRLTACSARLDQQPLRRHFKICVPGSCLPSQPRESDT
uniref:Uncharacterized protein n=1 Tax=Pan paniscus TaxID=9597 RepID=A0A2R9BYP5_PANPA